MGIHAEKQRQRGHSNIWAEPEASPTFGKPKGLIHT